MINIINAEASIPETKEIEYENQEYKINQNRLKLIGIGHIYEITIDGCSDAKGSIIGNLSIINKKSPTIKIGYFMFIVDTVDNKIFTKRMLPKHFELKNFSGIGKIESCWIPRNPEWTDFYLIGTAEKLIYI